MDDLQALVLELCKESDERTWLEFKHNNYDPVMIGEAISALANGAMLEEKTYAYFVWGVDNKTHELVGTDKDLQNIKVNNEELENWLRGNLSSNADFNFYSTTIDGKRIAVMRIASAHDNPVTFKKEAHIRIGSYTKKLREYPKVQANFWRKLNNTVFEKLIALENLTLDQALTALDYKIYFELSNHPLPENKENTARMLLEEGILIKQDNALYSITNLGAILFAKDLNAFDGNGISRKAVRIVQYAGNNRVQILKKETFNVGYVSGLESIIKYLKNLLPSKEEIGEVFRESIDIYPPVVVREAVANAIIHQDFSIKGTGPLIEIFFDRVEISNPGAPLVEIKRIVDNPPRSRNEKMANLMRRLRLCEELGSGWDRMVSTSEECKLLAPKIVIYDEGTKVILFSKIPFSNISLSDKLWATYMHACIMYMENKQMSNASLRERFDLDTSYTSNISRLIREAVKGGYIKVFDGTSGNKYIKYIPFWG